jgi:small conductance mechanosensitive channel
MSDLIIRQLQELVASAVLFIPNLVAAVVVLLATLYLGSLASRWLPRRVRERGGDPGVGILLGRLAHWTIIVLGVIVALRQVNFDVTGLIAGLGIIGFTLGFAFQDIAKNFVAGILLLLQQPFGVGEAIEVKGYSGEVLDIAVRATTIKTWDGQQVIIPNADVYTNVITNFSRFPLHRVTLKLGIRYEEDIERALRVFLGAIAEVDGVVADPAPTVHCDGLGNSAVEMSARFWYDQRATGLFDVTNRVTKALKEVAEKEGINLPYSIQTVYLRQLAA